MAEVSVVRRATGLPASMAFSTLIYHYTSVNSDDELVPSLASNDSRQGIEHFKPFKRNLLFASLCVFRVFFPTRLNGAFILSNATNLSEFVKNYIPLGFTSSLKELMR